MEVGTKFANCLTTNFRDLQQALVDLDTDISQLQERYERYAKGERNDLPREPCWKAVKHKQKGTLLGNGSYM